MHFGRYTILYSGSVRLNLPSVHMIVIKYFHYAVVNVQADASLEMERKHFYQESMKYVLLLQAVQERKKFEFVEIVCNMVTLYYGRPA